MQRRTGGPVEVAIVFGSGLSHAARLRIDGKAIPYEKLGLPTTSLAGHPGLAIAGTWNGKRVVAFAGRVHLYQGFDAPAVTANVGLAAAAGARTLVLTNAAGALNEKFAAGDLMLISDHINLTGATPVDGAHDANPFVDMNGAYAPHLRALARERAGDGGLREGVYAGVAGPAYETPAEAEALRRLGADAVGMSTVLETIAARRLGLDVLGVSLITNAIGPAVALSHETVLAASEHGGDHLAALIESVLGAL